jgi:hypothetical protein
MFERLVLASVVGILMLVSSARGAANEGAIRLSGKVENVKTVEEDAQSILVLVDLDLVLKNESDANVILYWHDFEIVGDLIFRCEQKQNRELLYQISTLPSTNRSPEWAELQKQLDVGNPPVNLTRTLRSGESLSLKRSTNLRIYKKGLYQSSWNEIRAASPVCLSVELDLFPSNLDRTSISQKSLGARLQKRWVPFGILQVGVLRSEPIKLDLSKL